MTSRPVVSVYSKDGSAEVVDSLPMPAVFTAPIRDDIVHFVHTNMSKNRRQAHGVYHKAGMEHSAESWGTGRAVARIPRIGGSGTSRSGQGAFGNQCRKGRMFAPLKTYRRWHRKINLNQRRHAVASAIAASAVTPLVLARGHRVNNVPELPLVVENLNAETTKTLLKTLVGLGAGEDLKRSRQSRKVRTGQGKMRNSRYVLRKGPLVVYGDENNLVKRTARNLPGVETVNVHRLNLLQLAPGGHLGRLVIWTRDAFKALNKIFGNYRAKGIEKSGYVLNRNVMTCADLARIINSDQVQSKLRQVRSHVVLHDKQKKNPLKNRGLMHRLNPHDAVRRAAEKKAEEDRHTKRVTNAKANRKVTKKSKAERRKAFITLQEGLQASFKHAEDILLQEVREGQDVAEEESEDDE
ncbi:60s ribosomal protein l4 [Stylonychia lemnae]|uniref:Large ribosomal subunit protein uL4 n=1 Tax=Stylonychia lemnae TaxID=5949 RepID=A0A078A214_STYLE|nr:60s ribosomal protein l4 [Stylonychia lemnae]|eukprot:CDW75533.1 60s ribosomal protein l4 [Stylonychia lemnae]